MVRTCVRFCSGEVSLIASTLLYVVLQIHLCPGERAR